MNECLQIIIVSLMINPKWYGGGGGGGGGIHPTGRFLPLCQTFGTRDLKLSGF